MLRPRISPTLLLQGGGLVKTERFEKARYIGDPINAVRIFNEKEADEIIVVDIDATVSAREPDFDLIENLASECRMPLCYGGGVRTVDQARRLVRMGVEKVAISSAALADPGLVRAMAEEIGRQSVCVVLDIKAESGSGYHVVSHRGRRRTGLEPIATACRMAELGAGEILINSVDRDGMMQGYDVRFAEQLARVLSTPFTMLGGAGSLSDMSEVVQACGPIGISAGSFFVYKGVGRAVLLTYPSQSTRDAIAARAFSGHSL